MLPAPAGIAASISILARIVGNDRPGRKVCCDFSR
jgi:hypothetical protein